MTRLFDSTLLAALRPCERGFVVEQLISAVETFYSAAFCADIRGPGRVLWEHDPWWRELLATDITDTLEDCAEIEDLGFQVGAPPEVYARVEAIRADATAALALLNP